jgi:hypothetical protein
MRVPDRGRNRGRKQGRNRGRNRDEAGTKQGRSRDETGEKQGRNRGTWEERIHFITGEENKALSVPIWLEAFTGLYCIVTIHVYISKTVCPYTRLLKPVKNSTIKPLKY